MTSLAPAKARAAREPRSKFGNRWTEVDGIRFQSKLEAKRWGELNLLERAGTIRNLRRQERFPLTVRGVRIGHYVADSFYFEGDQQVAEETKGFWTDLAKWKRKHFEAEYQAIELRIVKA